MSSTTHAMRARWSSVSRQAAQEVSGFELITEVGSPGRGHYREHLIARHGALLA